MEEDAAGASAQEHHANMLSSETIVSAMAANAESEDIQHSGAFLVACLTRRGMIIPDGDLYPPTQTRAYTQGIRSLFTQVASSAHEMDGILEVTATAMQSHRRSQRVQKEGESDRSPTAGNTS